MDRAASAITIILILTVVVGLPLGNPGYVFLAAAAPPNSPHIGTGSALDVHEFARNNSVSFGGAQNDTAFSYLSSWYPAEYRGYRLRAEVSSLRIAADPVPNGDFELFDEPGNNWTFVSGGAGGLVQLVDRVTGGNPEYCLDTQLKYGNVPGTSVASIENDFYYASSFQLTSLILEFDISFSADITQASWLLVNVSVVYQGSEVGRWSNNTAAYAPTSWEHHGFNTDAVNGSVILRITIQKNTTSPSNVRGHVYFDNFRYTISSSPAPSEVGLALNGTAFVDLGGSNGSADIYADPALKERASPIDCWSATQQFQFSAIHLLTFNYSYSMHIKMENPDAASTFFTAPADAAPGWITNYTIPGGRPPSGHTGYHFGLILPSGWTLSLVKNATGGTVSGYSYDPLSRFFLLNENLGTPGQTFSIYASSSNHILQIHIQRGPTSSGPWANITPADFFVTGDYVRAFAQLEPIGATGNSANVSVFFPNSTLWRSDAAPVFDANLDTLTSAAWQMPAIMEATAGDDWLVTVSFNTATQCGMRTQSFAAYIEPKGSVISPATGSRYLWGSTVVVNVTWRNNASLTYITGADVQVRYIDRYSVTQYAPMSGNGQGAYFWNISTSLLKPNRTAEFDVEFRKVGYVNASYSQGTHLPVVFNLVNDVDYHMVRPVQSSGPNEYTGETSVSVGFATQVRLYDFFEKQYARNDTAPWSGAIRFNCSRYEDTGSDWVFAGTDTFVPNGGDPTLFEKVDANYSASLLQVKYTVTARFVSGSYDHQQQNFTVIIEIVAFASNLDALRTVIIHPPVGDGWTVFNPALDAYEVRLHASELLNITVYYENVSALPPLPISDASADILVLGSWLSLSNHGSGYYSYTLDTTSLGIDSIQLVVNASRADCAAQVIIIHLVIDRRPCDLKPASPVIDVTWGDTFWVVAYFNDTLVNHPITGALIQYEWGSLSGTLIPTGVSGWYNISLPTTAHATGQESLKLTVSHGQYANATVSLSVNVLARPTQLAVESIEAHYPSANVTVPLSGTIFSVPVSDVFIVRLSFSDANGTLIDDATGVFTWSRGTAYLVYADGVYILQLNLSAVPPDSYLCSIQLSRQNYLPQSLGPFQLHIMLVPTKITGIENTIPQFTGQPFAITVFFNDTYHNLGITGADVAITISDLGIFNVKLADQGNGNYTLENLVYSVEGIFAVQIVAQGPAGYDDAQLQVSLVLRASAGGSPLFNLIALLIIVAAILSLSGYLAYSKLLRPRVLVPQRIARGQKLQDVADMFNDVVNLSRFLVLHRGSGIAIFDPFAERGMDAALFGGFLQAISAFAIDVARTTEDDELPLASPLHEITYEGFRILIHDGRFVRTALVFKGQPSENLKKKMAEFTTRFEAQYFKELGEWCCEPEVFQNATGLLEEIFHVSLLLPHKVQPKLPSTASLTPLEAQLHGIAMTLTQKRDSILLHEVIRAYTGAIQTDKLQVLSALNQLREKKLLVPIEFYRLTKKARDELAPEQKRP